MADINIGAISEALNDKVDLDLLNIKPASSSIGRIAGWSFPSERYNDLTLQTSGYEYTMPANGWLYLSKVSGIANGWIAFKNLTSNTDISDGKGPAGAGLTILMPVKKDDIVRVNYTATGNTEAFRFIYTDGDDSGEGGGGDQPIIYSGGGFPDYSKGETITTPYIIKKDGWVFWNASTAQGPQYLYVNDILVAQVAALGANDTTSYTATIPVFKGDNVRWGEGSAVYYPLKDNDYLGNRNIGTIIKTLIPQTDAGLHLLDGAVIQGDGIYEEFVNHMASLYGDGTNIPNYFTSESNWQYSVTTYGCCGKFVYDSENNTIRLPKFERILQGTLLESELGDRIEAGAPNITGSFCPSGQDLPARIVSGAFTSSERSGNGYLAHDPKSGNWEVFNLDASRSNPIYGNSDTIQPPVIKVLYYIVIATSTKTDIEVNIDNIVNDLDRKSDKDLSNTGCITNCLTSIPQDIKLELNNGILTLKAGSKIYVPNGNSVFNTVIIPNDITIQGWSNVSGIILIDNIGSSYAFTDLSQCYSGASSPTIADGVVWYDTTNNIVKRCNDGSTWTSGYSLPIAIATSNNSNPGGISGIASLDKVFNGFGFIGSVLFALPGVTGLLPNGRNEDGTLKNRKYTIDSVKLREFSWDISGSGQYLVLYSTGEILGSSATNRPFYQQEETPPTKAYSHWYKPSENVTYATFESETSWTKCCLMVYGKIIGDATGKISSLTTKTTFHAVDYNDIVNDLDRIETNLFNKIQEVSEPPVNYEQGVLYVIPED